MRLFAWSLGLFALLCGLPQFGRTAECGCGYRGGAAAAPNVTIQVITKPACPPCEPCWWLHCKEPPRGPVFDSVAERRIAPQVSNAAGLRVVPAEPAPATPSAGAAPPVPPKTPPGGASNCVEPAGGAAAANL